MKKIIKLYLCSNYLLFFNNSHAVHCQSTQFEVPTVKQIQLSENSEAYINFKTGFDKIKMYTKDKNFSNASYAELINLKTKVYKKYYAIDSPVGLQKPKISNSNEYFINDNYQGDSDLKIIKNVSNEKILRSDLYILNIYSYNRRKDLIKTNEYINKYYEISKNYNVKSKIYVTDKFDSINQNYLFKTNYTIIENINKNDDIYTFISNQSKFIPIKANENNSELFPINEVLNRFTGTNGTYYLHIALPKEAVDTNQWLFTKEASSYRISPDGIIKGPEISKYKISEGEIHPVDIITIELNEAKKQYQLYNSLMIKQENTQANKNAIYQIKFDKPSSFSQPRILNIENNRGNKHFENLKNAVKRIREKIADKNETTFLVNDSSKSEEIRKRYLDGLNSSTPGSKKTIAYAIYENLKQSDKIEKNAKFELFTVSGSNINFKNTDNENIFFSNYSGDSAKLPSFKVEDSRDFFKNEINKMQANLEKDSIIDGANKEINSNQRDADAEIKILESILNKSSNTGINTEGKLTIYSSLPVCLSCNNAFQYFNRLRPKISVEIFQVNSRDLKELYN